MSAFCISLRFVGEDLSDCWQSKFGWNLAAGSIEISDFGADVNSRATLNYSVLTRQVQLCQKHYNLVCSGGIVIYHAQQIAHYFTGVKP